MAKIMIFLIMTSTLWKSQFLDGLSFMT